MSDAPTLRQIENEYRAFAKGCPEATLHIVAIECDLFANVKLVIELTSPVDDPEALTSYIKARLLSLMPQALKGARGLRLRLEAPYVAISYHGRSFPQPTWFVSNRRATVGPLGFRHPEWDEEGKVLRFTLTETWMKVNAMGAGGSAMEGTKSSIVNKVAKLYKDRIGTFSL